MRELALVTTGCGVNFLPEAWIEAACESLAKAYAGYDPICEITNSRYWSHTSFGRCAVCIVISRTADRDSGFP